MDVLLNLGAALQPVELAAIHSALALADVLEILAMVPTGKMTPELVDAALNRYMQLFVACYDEAAALPKHHFAWHLPSIGTSCGFLIDCSVHERRHRGVKRYAQALDNTAMDYEHSVLAEFTHFHLRQLKDDYSPLCVPGLVPPVRGAANRLLLEFVNTIHPGATVHTSHTARYKPWSLVSCKNIVLIKVQNDPDTIVAGRVFFKCKINGDLLCCVDLWQRASANEHGACWWRNDAPRRCLAFPSEVVCTTISSTDGALTRTLLPLGCR